MNNYMRKLMLAFALLLGLIGLFPTNIANASVSAGYTLKPSVSDSASVNVDGGFYLIKGKPGEIVDIKVGIYNTDSETRQFEVNGNTAYTTDDGQPGFDRAKVSDPNLKIKLHDLFTNGKQVVSVPGNKSISVTLKLKVPEQKYTGYLMGGVNVRPYHEAAKGSVTENGTLIRNKFSYSIPVQMTQQGSQNDDVNYKINNVKPRIVGATHGKELGVAANVANTKNAYLPGLSSRAVITKYGDKKFKKVAEQDGQSIAPTSNYNYGISWGKDRFIAGKYHIKLTYSGDSVRTWVLDKDFVITNAQADKFNKLAGIKPNYMWLYILLAILLLALILGLGLYLGKRGNNNNNNNSNSLRTSSRKRRRR